MGGLFPGLGGATEQDDIIVGTAGAGSLSGLGGADTIYGLDGADSLSGDANDDALHGGSGRDSLDGGEGADRLNGGGEDDILVGGSGADLLAGGNDNDSLEGGEGDDTLIGGQNEDTLRGGDEDDVLEGGNSADSLFGDGDDDRLYGGSGNDTLAGGFSDTFRFVAAVGDPGRDTILDFERSGSPFGADRISLEGFVGPSGASLTFDDLDDNGNNVLDTNDAAVSVDELGDTLIDLTRFVPGGGSVPFSATLTVLGVPTLLNENDFVFA